MIKLFVALVSFLFLFGRYIYMGSNFHAKETPLKFQVCLVVINVDWMNFLLLRHVLSSKWVTKKNTSLVSVKKTTLPTYRLIVDSQNIIKFYLAKCEYVPCSNEILLCHCLFIRLRIPFEHSHLPLVWSFSLKYLQNFSIDKPNQIF